MGLAGEWWRTERRKRWGRWGKGSRERSGAGRSGSAPGERGAIGGSVSALDPPGFNPPSIPRRSFFSALLPLQFPVQGTAADAQAFGEPAHVALEPGQGPFQVGLFQFR